MHAITVWREGDAGFQAVGEIEVFDDPMNPPQFRYAEDYLRSDDAAAISASLPLQHETFDEQLTDAFFDGLLSEGDLRTRIATTLGFDGADVTEMLSALNYDTIGALVFTDGEPPTYEGSRYVPISGEEISIIAQDASRRLVPYARRTHVSLPGYMNKIGLVRGEDGGWLLPFGLTPSTWIMKFSDPSLGDDIGNEALCLSIAANLGLPSCEYEVVQIDGKPQAICLRRFDRKPNEVAPCFARRLHQEDFCQALGFAPALKYQLGEYGYFKQAVRLIRKTSARPAIDLCLFIDGLLLDYHLGNCDNHLKNYSLVYASDWRACRVAPVYDKICTIRYRQYREAMGIPLVHDLAWNALGKDALAEYAEEAGVPEGLLMRRFERLAAGFDAAYGQALEDLESKGIEVSQEVKDAVLRCADETRERML